VPSTSLINNIHTLQFVQLLCPITKVGALSEAAVRLSVCLPICLSHASSSETVHFRTLIGNPMLISVAVSRIATRIGQNVLEAEKKLRRHYLEKQARSSRG